MKRSVTNGRPLFRPLRAGRLELAGNLLLAPLAGWTDAPLRALCARYGASLTYTGLISACAVARSAERRPGPPEADASGPLADAVLGPPCAVQLFGGDAAVLARACAALAPLRPPAVDLNAGCPVPKVVKTGSGAALMRNPAALGAIVAAMRRACDEFLGGAPLSVKLRSGWDSGALTFLECARAAEEAGASLVTLHPRTRAQGYGGRSDWSQIAALKARLSVPVAGSGDLYAPCDAERMLRETGCDAVMFARGAMGNPFIFRETIAYLTEGAYASATPAEKVRAALEQVEALAAQTGERRACLEMRKAACAYAKTLRGGPEARRALVRAETLADYRRILEGLSRETAGEGA